MATLRRLAGLCTATALAAVIAAAVAPGIARAQSKSVPEGRRLYIQNDPMAARDLVQVYGRASYEPISGCGNFVPATVAALIDRTGATSRERHDGIVTMEFTIGADGLAHDPELPLAVPDGRYDRAAIESLLRSRFKPAVLDGVPVASRGRVRFTLMAGDNGELWSAERVKELRQAAERGDPDAQYVVATAALNDATLKIPANEARAMLVMAAQSGHPAAEYWLARELLPGPGCTDRTRADPWLEQAARHHFPAGLVGYAARLLPETPTAAERQRVNDLLAEAIVSGEPHQLRHAIALALDPRLQPASHSMLRDAAARLQKRTTEADPQDWEAIAAAAAFTGDFPKAVTSQTKAVSLARQLYWNTSLMDARLERYLTRHIYTGDLLELPPRTTEAPAAKGRLADLCAGPACVRRRSLDPNNPTGSHLAR